MNAKKQKSTGIHDRSSLQTGDCFGQCTREFNERSNDPARNFAKNITELSRCIDACEVAGE